MDQIPVPYPLDAPPVPPDLEAIPKREVPEWIPSFRSVAWGVFGGSFLALGPTYLFFANVFRDWTDPSVAFGVIPLLVEVFVIAVAWRTLRRLYVAKYGALVCRPLLDAVHTTERGYPRSVRFHYRFEVGQRTYGGKAMIEREGDMPRLPTSGDFVLVAYSRLWPRWNDVWGFIYSDGRISAEHMDRSA
jgi:hypothetical protein